MMQRYVTIHGHFYQPPRENPWLETVEVQDSAAPYHDWNARVAAECYAPNSASRRVDGDNRITDIVNNFASISFNMGPTLLHWLAEERPEVYARVVDADRQSVAARGGHGNAIAQPYGHPIMPLCTRRDKVTQVRWGLADFRHRFGRDPEGLWLPETAVDGETLEVLAEHDIRFTILAPRQAARVRPRPDAPWRDVHGDIDPSRAYRWVGPGGAQVALFFYDGPISHAIAFEGILRSGDALAERLGSAFDDRAEGQLVHVATDGESYGHHHPFGEMALAAACARIRAGGRAQLTNYGAFLAAHPPTHHVEIVEPSSWSCVHGVERWRDDCGCNAGRAGWRQQWRGPLRETLDWLRDRLDPLYEARAGALLKDPWAARDDYAVVLISRSAGAAAGFLGRHQLHPLSPGERVEALKLLEVQRHRLLMYTSCGWFFDEMSGIETVQILRYAARAIQLARQLGGGEGLEDGFLERLREARSNLPELQTGDVVYRRHVLPAMVDLRRVIAHYAITAPWEGYGEEASVYAFTVTRQEWHREAYGETSLSAGRVRVVSDVTTEAEEAAVAVLHFGGHDFQCSMRGLLEADAFTRVRDELFRCFIGHSLSEVVRALDRHFEGRAYGIRDLFLEERRRVLAAVTEGVLRRFEETYRRLYDESRRLMEYMRESDAPAPEALALAARYVLQRELERLVPALADVDEVPVRVREVLSEARGLGLDLAVERQRVAGHLERALLTRMARLWDAATPERVESVTMALRVGRELHCGPDLWAAQNRFFELWQAASPETRSVLGPLGEALGFRLDGDR